MLTPKDTQQLSKRGISLEEVTRQLGLIETGFPYLRLHGPATIGEGIYAPDEEECRSHIASWDHYLNRSGHRIVKFVPASGAASRMFKDLFAFLGSGYYVPTTPFEKEFFEHIGEFAFAGALSEACQKRYGKTLEDKLAAGDYIDIVDTLLGAEGLDYGHLPKGLLLFHRYPEGERTPMEEHLVEAALYAATEGTARIHFTVSPEHRPLFEKRLSEVAPGLETRHGVRFEVSFSEQKPSTDTIAANADNTPFRSEDGTLLFRPGGHGALIENLGDIEADIIFVKNIDNVVPDRLKTDTVTYKKLLAGILVELQARAFGYLRLLDTGTYNHDQLEEMIRFLQRDLCCRSDELKHLEDTDLALYLRKKLNRPMRVCGMVRNVGEPGGGPFLAYNADGTYSPQILESSQIDSADAQAKAMFEGGTHFNPVDLVCATKDYKGDSFDLTKYVDPATGFVSSKSKDGRVLKALELPGLWNGAMSDWNTLSYN